MSRKLPHQKAMGRAASFLRMILNSSVLHSFNFWMNFFSPDTSPTSKSNSASGSSSDKDLLNSLKLSSFNVKCPKPLELARLPGIPAGMKLSEVTAADVAREDGAAAEPFPSAPAAAAEPSSSALSAAGSALPGCLGAAAFLTLGHSAMLGDRVSSGGSASSFGVTAGFGPVSSFRMRCRCNASLVDRGLQAVFITLWLRLSFAWISFTVFLRKSSSAFFFCSAFSRAASKFSPSLSRRRSSFSRSACLCATLRSSFSASLALPWLSVVMFCLVH
mmetsp:Transcript_154057/g.272051  ORF Transcript_154057/g.272051 Transcript_154057/m.272051 type:complete len:275 (-) Transcript_154057:1423-2247(-)